MREEISKGKKGKELGGTVKAGKGGQRKLMKEQNTKREERKAKSERKKHLMN